MKKSIFEFFINYEKTALQIFFLLCKDDKKSLQGSFFIIYEKLKNRLFHKLWKNYLADFFFTL